MKIVLDINVVLDVLLEREPHVTNSARLFAEVERGHLQAHLAATSVDTLYYLLSKGLGCRRKARRLLKTLLQLASILPVDGRVIDAALASDWGDLEDAIIHEAAMAAGMNAIVSRDRRFSRAATLPAMTPPEILAAHHSGLLPP